MILKNKKVMIGTIIGVAAVGASLAIALPLSLGNKDKVVPKWNNPLPSVFYKANAGGANAYTTNKANAQGYVAQVNPEVATITPAADGLTITIDGNEINAAEGLIFDQKIPEGTFYKLKNDTSKEYTTDKIKAHDYKEAKTEVKPKIKETNIEGIAGGTTYDASKWTWSETETGNPASNTMPAEGPSVKGLRITSITAKTKYDASKWSWASKNNGSPKVDFVQEQKPTIGGVEIQGAIGGDLYNANDWSWSATKEGNALKPKVDEIKPRIKGIIVPGNGGATYDRTAWTWTKTKTGTPATTRRNEAKPRIGMVTITGSNGGDAYVASKWTWSERQSLLLANSKATFYDINLNGRNLRLTGNGTVSEKVAILDALNAVNKIAFTPSSNKILKFNNVALGTIPEANNSGANYETILNTDELKVKAFDLIVSKIESEPQLSSFKNKQKFRGPHGGRDGIWMPLYNGTEITTYRLRSRTKPTGGVAPSGFSVNDYKPGHAARAAQAGTKDEYTPLYKGTRIPVLKKMVNFGSSAPTGAPTNFVASRDFRGGNAETPAVPAQDTEYTAIYKGTEFSNYKKSLPFGSLDPTGAPMGFDEPTYNKGVEGVRAQRERKNTYTPSYDGTPIPAFNKDVSYNYDGNTPTTEDPEGEPTLFNLETDYIEGKDEVPAVVTKSDVYTASYEGTLLPEFTKEVAYTGKVKGAAPTGAPTTFVEADFNAGIEGQTANEPVVVTIPALSTLADQDTVKIDETTYTVNNKFVYQIETGKFASQTMLYAKGTNFVTDITQADGYVKEVIPQTATVKPKAGTTITIDGTTYTFK